MKQALKANENELLSDEELRAILKKFVEFRQAGSHIKPPILEIIEGYELCESVLNGSEDLEDKQMDIEDFCFTESWEERFSEAIDTESVSDFLKDLMLECSRRLSEEPEYQMFKNELKKKLKK